MSNPLDDTLDLIRAYAEEIAAEDQSAARLRETGSLLAERVTELDEALTGGAVLPAAWQH